MFQNCASQTQQQWEATKNERAHNMLSTKCGYGKKQQAIKGTWRNEMWKMEIVDEQKKRTCQITWKIKPTEQKQSHGTTQRYCAFSISTRS